MQRYFVNATPADEVNYPRPEAARRLLKVDAREVRTTVELCVSRPLCITLQLLALQKQRQR